MKSSVNLESANHLSATEVAERFVSPRRHALWLLGAMFVALLLRVHCLIFPYLWLDEYVTLWSIGGTTYGEMLDRALHWTASGPLFVLCYRASCDLAGNVEWGLKLPGVLGGTLSVWAAWWTARKLFDRTDVAAVAAWLVALAPQFIHFSQEARPYMIGTLLVMLSTGFLASWLRNQKWYDLAAWVGLSVAAVGFHLLAALAFVAQNAFVLLYGLSGRWQRRRWAEWFSVQFLAGCALWFVGVQFRMLSDRHGSMILETNLPMPTRLSLNRGVWGQFQVELTILLAGLGIWWCAKKFPQLQLAKEWNKHSSGVLLAASTYLVPTLSLTLLSAMRVLDCWARYYFLFHAGFMLALAWIVVCAFSKWPSRALLAAVVLGMFSQFNFVGGIPSCRLNGNWLDFSEAGNELRQRIGPDDLVLSRAGLVEANDMRFLIDPIGRSYLTAFIEGKDGSLPAEHVPLPFSPESTEAQRYVENLFEQRVASRSEFWLVNLGTPDFDYDDWIASRFGERYCKVVELNYHTLSVYKYTLTSDQSSRDAVKKRNLRLGPRDRLEGSMPAVNVGITSPRS